MSSQVAIKRPPKWLLRAGSWPRVLVRLGAGRLLGGGMVIVTHRGRRSGRLYRTTVQALDRDPQTGELFVVAWGREADWYKNLLANPAVEIWDAGRRYVPQQRLLSEPEIADKLLTHRTNHRFQAVMRSLFIPAPATRAEAERYARLAGGFAFRQQGRRPRFEQVPRQADAAPERVAVGSRA